MKESNQLHAVCLDTSPPLFYMNQYSKHIVNLVRDVNSKQTDPLAAYSIDAGFHVMVFTMKENVEKVKSAILECAAIKLEKLIETSIDPFGTQ